VRWIPVSLLGISIAMFSTVVIPTMPMIVNPRLLGTAFGLMEVMQNIAIGVFPLIIGELRHNEELNELQGFHLETIFLFLISCLCLGCSFILKAVDSTTGSRIDTKDFRKKYIQEVLKEDK
jgi:MFS family permease